MEEVDNIIIHSLRQIGCDIEEDVDSLKHFTTELVVEAAVKCLDIIQPGLGLPHSLPPSMSARYRLGTTIAQACQGQGYPGDIGYQTFLYSSETDVRRVFMFLIEKLPKDSEKLIAEPVGRMAGLEKAVSDAVRLQLSSPWLPSECRKKGVRWRDDGSWSREGFGPEQRYSSCSLGLPGPVDPNSEFSQAWREYYVHHLPLVPDQVCPPAQLVPSLIALNARGLLPPRLQLPVQPATELVARALDRPLPAPRRLGPQHQPRAEGNSRFALSEKLQFTRDEGSERKPVEAAEPRLRPAGAEQRRQGEEEEVARAREDTERLRIRLDSLQLDVKKLTAKLAQVVEDNTTQAGALRDREERCGVKQRTYHLLPEAEANLARLQTMVEGSAQRMVALAAQWEKHRVPLLDQYRAARQLNSNKASESQQKADAVRSHRDKVRDLSEETRSKEQLLSQLAAEYDKITKDINRSAYTRRILEIIGNIRKQKEEIDKVLRDTKELQKEINNLSGRLDRSFTVADELIFRDAKRDEASRRAYKLLATLHSDCGELVQMVEETGATVREIRDLEEQIETESAKNVAANLERISADLRQMKQESAALTVQLKSKS